MKNERLIYSRGEVFYRYSGLYVECCSVSTSLTDLYIRSCFVHLIRLRDVFKKENIKFRNRQFIFYHGVKVPPEGTYGFQAQSSVLSLNLKSIPSSGPGAERYFVKQVRLISSCVYVIS